MRFGKRFVRQATDNSGFFFLAKTKKPSEVRMGKGKGKIKSHVLL